MSHVLKKKFKKAYNCQQIGSQEGKKTVHQIFCIIPLSNHMKFQGIWINTSGTFAFKVKNCHFKIVGLIASFRLMLTYHNSHFEIAISSERNNVFLIP